MKKFNDDFSPLSVDEPIADAIYIDTEELSSQAANDSKFMLKDLEKIYGNEKFMAEHPEYKKRLDMELESIRLLLKMRRSDEITHDILIKQIGQNPNNASMYTALNRLQNSLLAIQTKLDETVKTVNSLLKNYQLELPLEQEEQIEEDSENPSINTRYRGSRQFILDMQNKSLDIEEDPETEEIFENAQ